MCVVQASPVIFDKAGSLQKACKLIENHKCPVNEDEPEDAQRNRLILFPEAFIPAYPRGLTFGATVGR